MGGQTLFTTLDLTVATGVHPTRILRDIRRDEIKVDRYGRDYLFTPEQFRAACAHYRKRKGAKSNAGERAGGTEGGKSDG